MRGMKRLALGAVLVLSLMLTGCGNDSGVYVQSVEELTAMGGIAPGDRFAGLVVSENVAEVQKDGEKTISELFVKEGDDVKEGDPLFAYDTEELQLTLDKQRLEKEQLVASIENYKTQIEEMEKDRNKVGASDKLQYTIQIQSTQVDLKEAELNLKTRRRRSRSLRIFWNMPPWCLLSRAGCRPSMKTAPTIMEIRCPISPSSSPAPTGSRAPWANCSGAA